MVQIICLGALRNCIVKLPATRQNNDLLHAGAKKICSGGREKGTWRWRLLDNAKSACIDACQALRFSASYSWGVTLRLWYTLTCHMPELMRMLVDNSSNAHCSRVVLVQQSSEMLLQGPFYGTFRKTISVNAKIIVLTCHNIRFSMMWQQKQTPCRLKRALSTWKGNLIVFDCSCTVTIIQSQTMRHGSKTQQSRTSRSTLCRTNAHTQSKLKWSIQTRQALSKAPFFLED